MPRISKCDNFITLTTKSIFTFLIFFILINNAFADAGSQNILTSTTIVCPMNLTEKLPCLCHALLEQKSVQIVCSGTLPEKIWNELNGYSISIGKMAIRDCSDIIENFQPVPPLTIRSLEISNCQINQMPPTSFDSLSNSLEELWLLNNSLTSIPKLSKLKNLVALNLNVNELKKFPDSSLIGLKKLKHLRLKKNKICSLVHPFTDQKNVLELLDLSQNCFVSIPIIALRGLLELKYLSLAGNSIEEIGPMHFMSLPQLVELRMQNNKLTRIVPNGFMNVQKLQILLLQNNSLSTFDPGTLEGFKELKLVDLSLNEFNQIPSFKDMNELIEVRLDNNRIDSIKTLAFSSNPNLQKISLSGNQIETIARNSFDALDQLEFLNLADNGLVTIERGMIEGMKHLKDLILRNNSINNLSRESFLSIQELVSLDLSHNELSNLKAGTFAPLQRLHILKLDNNKLETIEEGAFDWKVDTLLLDGNSLRCDDKLDWFVDWLVRNKVRTFVPDQPEIRCASPEQKRGTRLKELMIKRNNLTESLIETSLKNIPGLPQNVNKNRAAEAAGNFLANLLPNGGGGHQRAGTQIGSEMLNTFAKNIPELRNLPGMEFVQNLNPASSIGKQKNEGNVGGGGGGIDTAIDKFSEPLVKFASGVPPSSADVDQLLSSIPSLIVNVPGFGNVDVSKLNPSIVGYVLKGGQIPGIPRETLDNIVKQYMQRLYVAAAQAQGISTSDLPVTVDTNTTSRILRPISELPHGLVQSVIEGKSLPHLTTEQTNVIKEYYTQHAPIGSIEGINTTTGISDILPQKVIQMMQLLPKNYNLSKLQPEVVKQVMKGEMPDFTKLPLDLQQHIKDNFDKLLASLSKDVSWLAGVLTLGVLSAFLWYWRRTRTSRHGVSDISERGPGVLPSVVREQSFRPSAFSTLK
uniref:LRRCT domain-containing protein n=1 Tax=Meloidogyne javanica TaxID=6303 RepID=A0A915LX06_MELJA